MGTQPHKILLLVFDGAALLSVLSGCGPEYLTEEQVKEETLDYLSSQYSAEFTVTAAEEKVSGPSPIPSFKSKPTYWILTAASSQFPDETFTVTRSVNGDWIDNYYSLLLNDEAIDFFDKFVSESLDGGLSNKNRMEYRRLARGCKRRGYLPGMGRSWRLDSIT